MDSVKKILPTQKGKDKVNCYNLLSESYYWIWDENDKHIDTACMYSNKAYEEAKKINYKTGIAYAKANIAHCTLAAVDKNRDNNDKEPAYIQAYKAEQDALNLADQLKDDYLSGLIYFHLAWYEKWWGTQDKFKSNTQKAIQHFEKISGDEFKNSYKPLMLVNCPDCKGAEALLAHLYQDLSTITGEFNTTMKDQLEKAIFYYQKVGDKSGLGRAYQAYASFITITKDIEIGIEYLKKAVFVFREDNNQGKELEAITSLCSSYWTLGDFENGLDYGKKSLQIAEKLIRNKDAGIMDSLRLGQAYYWIGRFYSIASDYETAFVFMKKARKFYPNNPRWLNSWTVAMGELYRLSGNYDSAMYYLRPFEKNQGALSSLYISLKQYDKALQSIDGLAIRTGDKNNLSGLSNIYMITAKAYFGKKDYVSALNNAREGIALMEKAKRNTYLIDGYQLLSDIFNKVGKNDSAYFYLKQYTTLKDSLLSRQIYIRLNDYKKEAEEAKRTGQINLLQKDYLIKEQELQQQILLKKQSDAQLTLLDKDNELKDQKLKEQTLLEEKNQSQLTLLDKENKLKDERLKKQAFIRNALLGGLLLFILLGVFVFRNLSLKRKNEKLAVKKGQAELQQKVAELEMQALRAQMNPHFIFNCLSSINRFIFKNDNKLASDYLTRFSRLIRMVLMHSAKKLITLEDELEMLRLYLDLERLRFKDAFDYSITTTNIVDAGAIFIPPLLLQPFCENAVWHGLMHKESKGHLNVIISEVVNVKEKALHCVIEDDGIGREKAGEFKSKSAESKKSMGLKITTERLALLNQENNFSTFYKIEDVMSENNEVEGTRVKLKIRYKESIEETFNQNNITAENMSKKS